MTIFNKPSSKLLPSSVLKYRSKSQFAQAREIIFQLSAGSEESTATSVLGQEVADEIYNNICASSYQAHVENLLIEIIPPLANISNASEIAE